MKNIIVVLTLLCITIFTQNTVCQNNSFRIYSAYSIGKVDKRYEFLPNRGLAQTVKNKINDNTPDDEYAIGLGYNLILKKRLSIGIDLGYAKLVQDFLLPVNGTSYFYADGEKLYWRHKSDYHIIQISPQIKYVLTDGQFKFGQSVQFIGNVTFRKALPEDYLFKNKIEYFATEVYPGIFVEYKRIRANLGVRVLHMKYRDDAIYNNGKNPDLYNPLKIKFTLSYDLFKW